MAIGLAQLRWLMKQLQTASTLQGAGRLATRAGRFAGRNPGATAGIVTGATAGAGIGIRRRNRRQWSRDLNAGMSVTVPGGLLKRYERRGFPNRYKP